MLEIAITDLHMLLGSQFHARRKLLQVCLVAKVSPCQGYNAKYMMAINISSAYSMVCLVRCLYENRDFYFHAPGSLVVLSFPQPLNFSSVLPSL
jgi:hypothetical protein